jgi:uncharacterized protein YndB with AHSA1/START domain
VDIKAPADKVYAYVVDISRHPQWGMDDMEIDGPAGPAEVGSTYKALGTLRGKRNPSTVRITELDPPQRIEFEVEDSSGMIGHVFTFTPVNASTRVTRQMYAIKQPPTAPILYVMNRGAINRNFNGALAKLKARVEAGADA